MIGGSAGVSVVRKLSPATLRATVLLIGVVASVYLVATSW
jgi:uncharacterized membrane protein YfcA